MGTISDHYQLQQEQFALLQEFVAAVKINANLPKIGRSSIEEFITRGDSGLTFRSNGHHSISTFDTFGIL